MNRTSPFPGVDDPIALVRKIACQLASEYPSPVPVDDLAGAGLLAIVVCLDRFDPRRGPRFITFCWPRVRGAMIDYIRTEARKRMFVRFDDGLEVPAEYNVEDLVVERDLLDHIHRGIEKMPLRRRSYMKSVLEGCTDKGACMRAAVSRGAAFEMKLKAVRDLRSILEIENESVLRAAA